MCSEWGHRGIIGGKRIAEATERNESKLKCG